MHDAATSATETNVNQRVGPNGVENLDIPPTGVLLELVEEPEIGAGPTKNSERRVELVSAKRQLNDSS